MITVSVVIPTCNRSDYLAACLKSIRHEAKNAPALDIAVVDDGSGMHDAAKNRMLCEEYQAAYHSNQTNLGMAIARNKGIAATQGEWIVFIDDDATVDVGWYDHLIVRLQLAGKNVAGFEGRVAASGNGLWDTEVSNLAGGAFITCHMGVRRQVIDKCGSFDTAFAATGPYCEDHELAARLLLQGEVPFFADVSVTHAPRHVNFIKVLTTSKRRSNQLLRSDDYFYRRHPDRYHLFRAHRNFAGTYRSYLFKHLISTLRRRSLKTLLKNPLASLVLVLSTLLEQLAAWIMIPELTDTNKKRTITPFESAIGASEAVLGGESFPRVKGSFLSRGLYTVFHQPVYSLDVTVKKCCKKDNRIPSGFYLRIDDLFFDRPDDVKKFCAVMKKYKHPYLAAVTGNDLLSKNADDCRNWIVESNGVLALHGFTHEGHFGPFNSELLQMPITKISENVLTLRTILAQKKHTIDILVPPFNAIGPEQIIALSSMFKVICGGPETARFTDGIAVPFRIGGAGIYFPSFHPYYSSASQLLKYKKQFGASEPALPICITTHFTDERKDSFAMLDRFLEHFQLTFRDWNRVY